MNGLLCLGWYKVAPSGPSTHPRHPLHCCPWLCAGNFHRARKKLRSGRDGTDIKGLRGTCLSISSQHLHRAGFGGHHFFLFLPLPNFKEKREQALVANHKHTPLGERLLTQQSRMSVSTFRRSPSAAFPCG